MDTAPPVTKQVTFVTPVVSTPWTVEAAALHNKVTFIKNRHLHSNKFPPWINNLGHAMVIDLPLDGIEAYVTEYLHWLPLLPDGQLLHRLNNYLTSITPSKK